MTQREFCYWLQGFFEIGGRPAVLSTQQISCVQKHIDLVEANDGQKAGKFVYWLRGVLAAGAPVDVIAEGLAKEFTHVIDKDYANPDQLNAIHGDALYRC